MLANSQILGVLAGFLAIVLGLLPYEAPKGKRVSTRFYILAWCAVAGALWECVSETDMATLAGFLLIGIGFFGLLYHFIKGGTTYVVQDN